MTFRFKRRQPVDVPTLLERLGIRAKRIQRTKWEALCPHPEHQDHSPSWFIRDDPLDPYHATHCCKSCGFSGGTRSLVEEVLGLDADEAREWIGELRGPIRHPLRIEVEVRETGRIREMRLPPGLKYFPGVSAEFLTYLSDRRIGREQISRWGIGEVTEDEILDGEPHRLRGRVVVPILDRARRLLSYTARDYTGRADVRYLEPKREEGTSPAGIFGEELWTSQRVCVVCEGCFDGLAIERVVDSGGVAFAALRGSSPHPSQLAKLIPDRDESGRVVRGFDLIVVATDNDAAGIKAAKELRLALGSHVEVRRACPPKGIDLAGMGEEERGAFLSGILATRG